MSAPEITTGTVKLAWIRDAAVPAGQPALGRLDCTCGAAITGVAFGGPDSTCGTCGQTWDGRGWLVGAPTTTELAAIIEASPLFDTDGSAYFDRLAGKYGRDFTGIAWTQAILKRRQQPAAAGKDER